MAARPAAPLLKALGAPLIELYVLLERGSRTRKARIKQTKTRVEIGSTKPCLFTCLEEIVDIIKNLLSVMILLIMVPSAMLGRHFILAVRLNSGNLTK